MRIEKSGNGLYQAKVAQQQVIAVDSQVITVSNNLATSAALLDTKINVSNKATFLNSFAGGTRFSTTSGTFVSVTGSNTTLTKASSGTILRVSVFLRVSSDSVNATDMNMGELAYSLDNGSTWLGGTVLGGSWYDSLETPAFLVHYNLGTLQSGTINFRLGIRKTLGNVIYVNQFSYIFTESPNA